MGRARIRDAHLPRRIYLHHGAYWYKPKEGKPIRIGRMDEKHWGELEHWRRTIKEFAPQAHAKALFRTARSSATSRHLQFELTLADVQNLLAQSNYRCAVSGIPFSYERITGARVRPWIPSIDRINGGRGYALDNCRVVCAYVNLAMNSFGLVTLLRVAKAMSSSRRPLQQLTAAANIQPLVVSPIASKPLEVLG